MKRRVIFQDVDGVLVNRQSFRMPRTPVSDYPEATAATAFPTCVEQLNRIVKETDAVLVISSVWRHMKLKVLREIFGKWGVVAEIIDITPDLSRPVSVPYEPIERGMEIQAWLNTAVDVESFVILDDDGDMAHLMDRLVQCEFETGLTAELADRAIELLRSTNGIRR